MNAAKELWLIHLPPPDLQIVHFRSMTSTGSPMCSCRQKQTILAPMSRSERRHRLGMSRKRSTSSASRTTER
jgi:hypothetical protein